MQTVFTIGYEGACLDSFISALREAGVELLLDVRELPISRRRGFSKTSLSEALQQDGIGYRHERKLGSPKVIRHRLREDGDYDSFFEDFRRHLANHTDLIERMANELTGPVALMCYERDATTCHRTIVAEALADLLGGGTQHLGVDRDESSSKARNAPCSNPRQSVSTTQ